MGLPPITVLPPPPPYTSHGTGVTLYIYIWGVSTQDRNRITEMVTSNHDDAHTWLRYTSNVFCAVDACRREEKDPSWSHIVGVCLRSLRPENINGQSHSGLQVTIHCVGYRGLYYKNRVFILLEYSQNNLG